MSVSRPSRVLSLLWIHVYLEGERRRDASVLPPSCFISNVSLRQFVKAASSPAPSHSSHLSTSHIPMSLKHSEPSFHFFSFFFLFFPAHFTDDRIFRCLLTPEDPTQVSTLHSLMRTVQSFPQFKGIDHSKLGFAIRRGSFSHSILVLMDGLVF